MTPIREQSLAYRSGSNPLRGAMSHSSAAGISWSYSRERTWNDCRRAYGWRYLAAPAGGRPGADAEVQLAYRLSRLKSLSMALGESLHRRAAEYAAACRDGLRLPTLKQSRERTAAELNFLWVSSRRHHADHVHDPRRWPRLLEAENFGGPTRDQLAATREKAERCAVNLHSLELWAELRECDPGSIAVVEQPVEFAIEDAFVIAAPDLVFANNAASAFTVVDFKSSSQRCLIDSSAVARQVAGYSLAVVRALGARLVDDACEARVICLGDGTVEMIALTSADLHEAAAQIRASVNSIRDGGGYPRPASCEPRSLPMNPSVSRCRWCAFYQLCSKELIDVARASSGLSVYPWSDGSSAP